LIRLSKDEKSHYEIWKSFTKKEVKPSKLKIFKFYWLSRIFGLTFSLKLMESGEGTAQENYGLIAKKIPEAKKILKDESKHEKDLINIIHEEKLNYVGSIVLGLNDALVELTGALAGMTFALKDTKIIGVAGLVTGIAASFSMAASEYLSNKADGNTEIALKSSIYTGIAYIITVALLIIPYFLISNYWLTLTSTLATAVIIIFVFNYYISVAKDFNFKKRFFEMAFISLGVAAISFCIGFALDHFILS